MMSSRCSVYQDRCPHKANLLPHQSNHRRPPNTAYANFCFSSIVILPPSTCLSCEPIGKALCNLGRCGERGPIKGIVLSVVLQWKIDVRTKQTLLTQRGVSYSLKPQGATGFGVVAIQIDATCIPDSHSSETRCLRLTSFVSV